MIESLANDEGAGGMAEDVHVDVALLRLGLHEQLDTGADELDSRDARIIAIAEIGEGQIAGRPIETDDLAREIPRSQSGLDRLVTLVHPIDRIVIAMNEEQDVTAWP